MHVVSTLNFMWYRKSPRNLGGIGKNSEKQRKHKTKQKQHAMIYLKHARSNTDSMV